MHISVGISQEAAVFHGYKVPEPGTIVGYAAIIHSYRLPVPLPASISLISGKNRKYVKHGWQVFGPRYQPADTLYKHLVFALHYEGIQLLCLKKLFTSLSQKEVIDLIQTEPNGQYCRRLWFLFEWLMDDKLFLPDAEVKTGYTPLLNPDIQYALVNGSRSTRHRIINNLPGAPDFCPLVFKTEKLESYIHQQLSEKENRYLKTVHKDILQRAASFLLLKDSKASFTIEGESPKSKRAARWGKAIGQAGGNPLSKEELLRLQQLVIENMRFVRQGFRSEGGFVGEHDRSTGEPVPGHISARPQDLDPLIKGLIDANNMLEEETAFDAVIAAAMVAFGFVFIHPFQDGNGRIHRYLIHHILARKHFTHQGLIFPVSAAILDHIDDYRRVLEKYSVPLLDLIDWKTTSDNNIEVLDDTADYYRYFDATPQAEFLYDMVYDTIHNIIPQEVTFLEQYDQFKLRMDEEFEMPDQTVSLLVHFLAQNNGSLSKRAREKEFAGLTEEEVQKIEKWYHEIFTD